MSKGNSLVSFTINCCLSLPHDVFSQLRKNIWSINMCLLVSLLMKSKAKKMKKIISFCPHNLLSIFPNLEPLRISYHHHLNIMPVC